MGYFDPFLGTESTPKGYLAPIPITEFYLKNIYKDPGRWKNPNISVCACIVVRSLVPRGGESTKAERLQKWPQSCQKWLQSFSRVLQHIMSCCVIKF